MKRILVLTLIVMTAFSMNAFASKIGVLDFQQVLKQSEAGKQVYNKLQAQAGKYDKKLRDLGDKIKAAQQEYAQKESIYTEDTKEKKRTEIQRMIRDFNGNKQDYAKEMKRLEMRHLKKVQDDVMKIVNNMGKELGYDIIFEVQNSGVIYRKDSIDITDNVIKRYDNVYKQSKK